jgi:gamma-glutamylaminecyclotransferase
MTLLFVYGSLKQGFPNAHVNRGERLPGMYRTHQALPMYLLGDGQVPCLVLAPGSGHQVSGELYRVDAAALEAMDRLERLGEADGYLRESVEVETVGAASAEIVSAFAYMKRPEQLPAQAPRVGPLAEYLVEHARHLHW